MSDIAKRLRDCAETMRTHKAASIDAFELDRAADEIDRLRSAIGDAITLIEVASDYASESVDWATEAHAFLEQHKK
jgi:hypothetical protein